ncbi:hypothetical protein D3C78_1473860 [compost metagenome]
MALSGTQLITGKVNQPALWRHVCQPLRLPLVLYAIDRDKGTFTIRFDQRQTPAVILTTHLQIGTHAALRHLATQTLCPNAFAHRQQVTTGNA